MARTKQVSRRAASSPMCTIGPVQKHRQCARRYNARTDPAQFAGQLLSVVNIAEQTLQARLHALRSAGVHTLVDLIAVRFTSVDERAEVLGERRATRSALRALRRLGVDHYNAQKLARQLVRWFMHDREITAEFLKDTEGDDAGEEAVALALIALATAPRAAAAA